MLYFPKWKTALVILVSLAGVIFTLPNFLDRKTLDSLPDWLPKSQVNLGLDLRGGSHLLLEVDSKALIKELLENKADELRSALREAGVKRRTVPKIVGETIQVTIPRPEERQKAYEAVRNMAVTLPPNPLQRTSGGRDIDVSMDDNGTITIRLTEAAISERLSRAVDQSIEIIRRRVDAFGVSEPTIQRQGRDRILVQLPGLEDPGRLKRVIGKTAKLTFRMVDTNADPFSGRVPPGSELLYERGKNGEKGRPWIVRKRVEVSGENLVDAEPTFQQGQPVVSFRFDTTGAKKFARVTQQNVGRPFAIVLDNTVISAPRINEPILGGSGIISGGFTSQTANDLAILLRAGALPAPLKYLEERTVGPDLGADSIAAGKIAAISAVILVMVFMVLTYGIFGMMANLALLVNLFLIFGSLSLLQAALTLPGIAGIVLTIGMAVDANVLIFERIKEEIRANKSPFNAVEAGFKRAFTTIVDANVTTGIAALILFAMGSGPVKGFAVTLGIGILSSMFTAILLTRLVMVIWMRRVRPKKLAI